MAKEKTDLDDMDKDENEESGPDTRDKILNTLDGISEDKRQEYLLKRLLTEIKGSAGKDSKISDLLRGETGGTSKEPDMHITQVQDMMPKLQQAAELLGSIKEREKVISQREQALNLAIEKHLPVNLALSNSDDLEGFEQEISEFADELEEAYALKHGSPKKVYKGDGLTELHIKNMSRAELSRVPAAILDRLRGDK